MLSPAEKELRRQAALEQDRKAAQERFDVAMTSIYQGTQRLLQLPLTRLQRGFGPYPEFPDFPNLRRQFMLAEAADQAVIEEVQSIVLEWMQLDFSPGRRVGHHGSFFSGYRYQWDKDAGTGWLDASFVPYTLAKCDQTFLDLATLIPYAEQLPQRR